MHPTLIIIITKLICENETYQLNCKNIIVYTTTTANMVDRTYDW